MRLYFTVIGIGLSLLGLTGVAAAESNTSAIDPTEYSSARTVIKSIKLPEIERPQWLKKQQAAEAAARRAPQTITVTYDTATRGAIYANFSEFKLLANQTLNDSRGWSRMNVKFVEVASGGMFTLTLASAEEVGAVPGCGSEYSCRSGRFVLINQDRWTGATPSWNQAGGSLRDYRHMVVNHETGHWLGHGHSYCGGAGQPAPVMQQQSISLQGCSFNPWPRGSELYSPTLGI